MLAINLATGDCVEPRGFHNPVQLLGYLHFVHDGTIVSARRWCASEAKADRRKGERPDWESWEGVAVTRTPRGLGLGNWFVRTDGHAPVVRPRAEPMVITYTLEH